MSNRLFSAYFHDFQHIYGVFDIEYFRSYSAWTDAYKQKNAALKERVQELEGLARHENEDWLRLVEVPPALNSVECHAKFELFLMKKEEVHPVTSL